MQLVVSDVTKFLNMITLTYYIMYKNFSFFFCYEIGMSS